MLCGYVTFNPDRFIKAIERISGAKPMLKKATFFGTLAGFGFLLGAISGALAVEMPETHNMPPQSSSTQFQRIDQPLANKVAVTLGGLGLMGLELWWFLLSKPKSQRVETREGIQEVTITVDGGYDPSRIVVQVGQPVRLNFLRRDPSSCLEEVRLPDFHIAQNLALNKVTAIEFTPTKPGNYEFVCGMNMFRGVIEVTSSSASSDVKNPSNLVLTPIAHEHSV
jgi:plastocyanin domain-containing protein